MEIILAIMCVVSACSIFLGHAFGYRSGKRDGYRKGIITAKQELKLELNKRHGRI
jgi:hypothetical protein